MRYLPAQIGEGVTKKISVYHMTLYHYDFHLHESKTITQDTSNVILWYVITGNFELRINDQNYILKQGECYMYYSQDRESVHYYKQCHYNYYTLHIPLDVFRKLIDSHHVFEIIDRVTSVKITQDIEDVLSNIMKNENVYELLNITLEKAKREGLTNFYAEPVNDFNLQTITKAKQILDHDLTITLSREELAKHVGMSTSLLSKTFLQVYGVPVHTYIVNKRLNKAASLLKETDIPIKQIAEMVGYPKACNFSQAFKKKYGVQPSKFRLGKD